jgi:hypothetical protein
MSTFVRRDFPLAITFIIAVLSVFAFFFKVKEVDSAVSVFTNWGVLVAAFAVIFGAATALITHTRKIRQRQKGTWYLSLWLLIVMVSYIVVGVTLSPAHKTYQDLYNAVLPMLNTAMWALTGAATASAAVRCFRLKSIETSLILVPALIGVLMTAPVWDASWSGFATIGDWINKVPSTAGNRGFIIGAAVGAMAVALRTIIGRETGYLGKE